MTILLHGENSLASRNRLTQLKSSFDGEVVEVTDPSQVVETSLFESKRLFVVWQDKKISATQIKELEKKFENLSVEEFKINPVVFKFLDSLQPGTQKTFLPLWQEYLKNDPAEVAFVMLVRQFRLMIDPDNADVQPWQKNKIKSQADLFGQNRLIQIYKKLLDIDYQTKTGQSLVDLRTALELLLLTI